MTACGHAGWGSFRGELIACAVLLCLLPLRALAQADTTTAPSASAADSRAQCVQSHEDAQVQRLGGHPLQARALLEACASEPCPALVREDCGRWLQETRAQIPSLIFEVLTDAGPTRSAEIYENGAVLLTQLDGQPFDIDPGLHTFEVHVPGAQPKTVSVLVQQGEQRKLATIDFRSPAPAPAIAQPAAPALASAPVHAPARATRTAPTLSYVLAGVAVVALGTGVGFGVDASDREGSARRGADACAPACTEQRVDAMQRSALVADIGFCTALVATAGAIILYLVNGDEVAHRAGGHGARAHLHAGAWLQVSTW